MQSIVNLKAEALKNGLFWGIISIIIFLVSWYVMPHIMSSFWYSGLNLVIGVALAVFFILDMRKKAGGYWTFSEALVHIFIMFLVSSAILYFFTIVFGRFIDPTYPVKMKEMIVTQTESTLQSLGLDENAIETAVEDAEENLNKQFNPNFSQAVVGFGISSIMYFIGALIFALIFKKQNPNPWANLPSDEEKEGADNDTPANLS